MSGKMLLYLLAQIINLVASDYLHVPSVIELKPSEPSLNKNSDFGFSIGYQKATRPNLVIGSPHGDFDGQVYICHIEDVLRNSKASACRKLDINVEKLASNTNRTNYEEQNFCLGASIAATPDYFLTCAPLWTTTLKGKKYDVSGPYGICFIYDGYNATRYTGYIENNKDGIKTFENIGNIRKFLTGHGWSTLFDETNNYIFIGKPSNNDVLYVNATNPTSIINTMLYDPQRKNFGNKYSNRGLTSDYNNIGYALAKGRFFSDRNETMYYAISMQDKYRVGKVAFAKMNGNVLAIEYFLNEINRKIMVAVTDATAGSMFGAALLGTDVNFDGVTDLLVGAPAYVENGLSLVTDVGALYIYLGGDMTSVIEDRRRREILASKDGGRFGTAIAATDIDGDNLPEIFVTAPYENSGVLYILFGHDVNKKISSSTKIQLSEIKSQRIQQEGTQTFGFSLQIVDDMDENGCDELAVGSPGSSRVMLYRCLPAMVANISTELIEKNVKENDSQFNVKVCIDVKFPSKVNTNKTKLIVSSSVTGKGASLPKPRFEINLLRNITKYCEVVTVEFKYNQTGLYKFTTEFESNEETFLKSEEFDSSWVVLSQYSRTKGGLDVQRRCDVDDDCIPKLEMSLLWDGRNDVNNVTYDLGSTAKENVTVLVENKGTATEGGGCVRVRVQNALDIANIGCEADYNGDYICYLPTPLQRNAKYPINIELNMTKYTNMDDKKKIQVFAYLEEICNSKNLTAMPLQLDVDLNLNTELIEVLGSSNNITITDVEKSNVIKNEHEYKIINKGFIKWKGVNLIMRIKNETFIAKYDVYTKSTSNKMKCALNTKDPNIAEFNCTVDLMPNSTTKIFADMDISRKDIMSNVKTSSNCSISFLPTSVIVTESSTTEIFYVEEITLANMKWLIILIAVVVAILILAIVVFVLYKDEIVGFFKRKQKQRLESFRQSVKKSTADSNEPKPDCEDDDMDESDMEVVDDCPFNEPEPITSADNVHLIVEAKEDKVEVLN